MSIYTAVQSRGNPDNAFKEAGLDRLMAASIDELSFTTLRLDSPKILQQVLIQASLPSYLASTFVDKEQPVVGAIQASVLAQLPDVSLPWEGPVVQVDKVRKGDEEKLIGMGFQAVAGRKDVYVGVPTHRQANELRRLGYSENESFLQPGHVNPSAVAAYFAAWKLILAGAMTTWVGYEGDGSHGAGTVYLVGNKESGTYKKEGVLKYGRGETRQGKQPVVFAEGVWGENLGAPLIRLEGDVAPFATGLDREMGLGDLVVSIEEAKAAFSEGGHVFPYFPKLVADSRDWLQGFILNTFVGCFSSSDEALAKIVPMIRAGLRLLSNTSHGKALSHAAYGLHLAMMSTVPVLFLRNGPVYCGFVLGRECRVITRNTIVQPLGPVEFRGELEKIDIHTASLKAIFDILDGTQTMVEIPREVDRTWAGATSRNLANTVVTYAEEIRQLDDDTKKKLDEALDNLRFGDTFYSISRPAHLQTLIDCLTTGSWAEPSAPFFLRRGVPYSTNPITRALAAFGGLVPTIAVMNGDVVKKVSATKNADPNLAKDKDNNRVLQYIPVYARPIFTATKDWEWVRANGAIRYLGPRKGKDEFAAKRDAYVGGENFGPFYEKLREFINKNRPRATGGKRKADASPEKEDRRAEKKKKGGDETDVRDDMEDLYF